jgi:predicted nuclease with TOPRIM domain
LRALETDNISRRLANIIKLALAARNEEIERKMEEVKLSVKQLRAEITTKDAVIAQMNGKCQQLEGAYRDLKMQLDYQENQRRCDNLVFAGLAVTVACG